MIPLIDLTIKSEITVVFMNSQHFLTCVKELKCELQWFREGWNQKGRRT